MTLLNLLVIILIAGYFLERFLDYLNARQWSDQLPAELEGLYDEAEYRKAQQYEKANKRIAFIEDTLGILIMVTLLLTGSFGKLDDWAISVSESPVRATLLFFGIIAIASEIIGVPFSVYRTFVIEEKFGFNKTTPGTFITDKLKSYILGIVILGSLIILFSYLYNAFQEHFWMYSWAVAGMIMIVLSVFYTSWFLPLFNKLKPLEDGPLREAIIAYCQKTGFGICDVLVMDGSKRSSKANAFFSGLGARKKIVLFDTLLEKHSLPELVSVLAHETGHYKLKHIQSGLVLSLMQIGALLFLFSIFMNSTGITEALGGHTHTIELGILAFGVLYTPISIAVSLVINYLSRKHEYEADRYAATTYNGTALKSALKKLSINNLSNLNPHPAYVFFYYSHPPLLSRLRSLDKVNQTV